MKPKDPHFNLKVTISAVALAMIGMHFIWPRLTLDAIGLGLVVVGLAPWMAPLVKAIKLPGGLELELQELRDKTNDARGAAASARQRADIALSQTNLASPESVTVASANLTSTSAEEAFGKLADEYARLRHDFWSGAERTQKMTGVVGRIVELSKNTNWNTSQYLIDK